MIVLLFNNMTTIMMMMMNMTIMITMMMMVVIHDDYDNDDDDCDENNENDHGDDDGSDHDDDDGDGDDDEDSRPGKQFLLKVLLMWNQPLPLAQLVVFECAYAIFVLSSVDRRRQCLHVDITYEVAGEKQSMGIIQSMKALRRHIKLLAEGSQFAVCRQSPWVRQASLVESTPWPGRRGQLNVS